MVESKNIIAFSKQIYVLTRATRKKSFCSADKIQNNLNLIGYSDSDRFAIDEHRKIVKSLEIYLHHLDRTFIWIVFKF